MRYFATLLSVISIAYGCGDKFNCPSKKHYYLTTAGKGVEVIFKFNKQHSIRANLGLGLGLGASNTLLDITNKKKDTHIERKREPVIHGSVAWLYHFRVKDPRAKKYFMHGTYAGAGIGGGYTRYLYSTDKQHPIVVGNDIILYAYATIGSIKAFSNGVAIGSYVNVGPAYYYRTKTKEQGSTGHGFGIYIKSGGLRIGYYV